MHRNIRTLGTEDDSKHMIPENVLIPHHSPYRHHRPDVVRQELQTEKTAEEDEDGVDREVAKRDGEDEGVPAGHLHFSNTVTEGYAMQIHTPHTRGGAE